MKASEALQRGRARCSGLRGFWAYPGSFGDPGYHYLLGAVDAARDGDFLDWVTDDGVRAVYDIAISMALSDEAVGL